MDRADQNRFLESPLPMVILLNSVKSGWANFIYHLRFTSEQIIDYRSNCTTQMINDYPTEATKVTIHKYLVPKKVSLNSYSSFYEVIFVSVQIRKDFYCMLNSICMKQNRLMNSLKYHYLLKGPKLKILLGIKKPLQDIHLALKEN